MSKDLSLKITTNEYKLLKSESKYFKILMNSLSRQDSYINDCLSDFILEWFIWIFNIIRRNYEKYKGHFFNTNEHFCELHDALQQCQQTVLKGSVFHLSWDADMFRSKLNVNKVKIDPWQASLSCWSPGSNVLKSVQIHKYLVCCHLDSPIFETRQSILGSDSSMKYELERADRMLRERLEDEDWREAETDGRKKIATP